MSSAHSCQICVTRWAETKETPHRGGKKGTPPAHMAVTNMISFWARNRAAAELSIFRHRLCTTVGNDRLKRMRTPCAGKKARPCSVLLKPAYLLQNNSNNRFLIEWKCCFMFFLSRIQTNLPGCLSVVTRQRTCVSFLPLDVCINPTSS